MPVAKNAIEKNIKVSSMEPKIEEVRGATNQIFFLKCHKFEHLNFEQ